MSMGARGGGGGARSAMRSLTRDPAVKDMKLKPCLLYTSDAADE